MGLPEPGTVGELVAKLMDFDQSALVMPDDGDGTRIEIAEGDFVALKVTNGSREQWIALESHEEPKPYLKVLAKAPCVIIFGW